MTELRFSPFALDQAVEQGLIEDKHDIDIISSFVEQAALCTHELGNRRYGSFIFLVADSGVVQMVNATEPVCPDCKGTRRQATFEPCEFCEGDGCRHCGNVGGFSTSIRCQTCKEIDQ